MTDEVSPETKALMKIASTHAIVVLDDGGEGRAMWFHQDSLKMKIRMNTKYITVPVSRIKEVR